MIIEMTTNVKSTVSPTILRDNDITLDIDEINKDSQKLTYSIDVEKENLDTFIIDVDKFKKTAGNAIKIVFHAGENDSPEYIRRIGTSILEQIKDHPNYIGGSEVNENTIHDIELSIYEYKGIINMYFEFRRIVHDIPKIIVDLKK